MANTTNIYFPPALRRKAERVARILKVKPRAGKVNTSATIEAAFDRIIETEKAEQAAAKRAEAQEQGA